REDAERPERHAHAEHGHDSVLQDAYHPSHPSPDTHRSSRSSVGMPFVTLCVTPNARQAPAETLPRSPGCRAVDRSLSSCAVR
ncbi:hypothetical protein CCL16_16600, partial [Pseudomonas syringae]